MATRTDFQCTRCEKLLHARYADPHDPPALCRCCSADDFAIARIVGVPWWRRALAFLRSLRTRRVLGRHVRAMDAAEGIMASAAANQARWDAWVQRGKGRELIDRGCVRPPPMPLPGPGEPRSG